MESLHGQLLQSDLRTCPALGVGSCHEEEVRERRSAAPCRGFQRWSALPIVDRRTSFQVYAEDSVSWSSVSRPTMVCRSQFVLNDSVRLDQQYVSVLTGGLS